MNILITNDDGPNSKGTEIIHGAVKAKWPEAKIVVLVPELGTHGRGMSIEPGRDWNKVEARRLSAETYAVAAYPADVVLYAMFRKDLFLVPSAKWDYVFSGVNMGHNVGFDVFHSGTVGQAIIASHQFGVTAVAFSQEMDDINEPKKDDWLPADRILPDFLRKQSLVPGDCINVNFPKTARPQRGYKDCQVAYYSAWRTPHTDLVPRAHGEISDVVELNNGYTTVSSLDVRPTKPLRF